MKKSVRIRKALPGEQPGYYNKTAKFLKKAQMGMQVNSPSNDPQRLNAIYTNVYASLMSDITPDVIYSSLIGEYALDENTALMILRSALGKLAEEGKINPESLEGGNSQQNQKQEEQPSETQDRKSQEEYNQRMSEDAEQDELAMSDEGYYDEEEAANNDNSYLDTEEEQQQQAFAFGGYYDDGGESNEDYSDYYDDSNQSSSPEEAVINQYNNPGQNKMEKPFSIEDLINMTPGIQGTQAIPGIEDYLGDYRPISESYGSMNYLPTAKYGLGKMPKYQPGGEPPKGGLIQMASEMASQLGRGPSVVRQNNPLMNMSGIRRMLPLATLTGQAIGKLPLIGKRLQPEFKTTFTQNRNHLWEVLNGASPNKDIFSQVGGRTNPDGSLQANRLLLYQEDVNKILRKLDMPEENPPFTVEADGTISWDYSQPSSSKTFKLGDIQPMAAADGLVSGVYPMDAKVTGGVDDEGNKFFEISHKFGPNQTLPFGSTSNRAKELTVKNRFYYNQTVDPNTNQPAFQVFGPLGENLIAGNQTKYRVKRPLLASALMSEKESLLNDPNTPFPNFTADFGRNPNGPFTSAVGRVDITSTPPATVDRLSTRGKIGRGLENLGLSTWVPQTFGLGNPLRTSPQNVDELVLPTLGFSSSASGPNLVNPALETGVADDISRATNYRYRIGRNALLGAGALGYLGYKTWDSFYNQCQCDDPTGNNYMPKDEYGNCPCGGDVGDKRMLDPTGQPIEQLAPEEQLTVPDSMKFLDEQGLYPTKQNYYRLKGKNKRSQAVDYKKGGQIPKYQPGGQPPANFNLLQRYTEGLEAAEQLYNVYRGASFNQFRPAELKEMRRDLNLPEFLANERLAQDAMYVWPTNEEIEDALDIQERILSGNITGEIPVPLWRTNRNRVNYPLPFRNMADMPGLQAALSQAAGTPPPLQPITEISLDDLINLQGNELQTFVQRRQLLDASGRPHHLRVFSPSGSINVSPKNTSYADPNEYSFYANMANPMEAGKALLKIGDYGFAGANPIIRVRDSLSLDSFPLLTNLGRRKDWTLQPIHEYGVGQGEYGPVGPQLGIDMNSMARHNVLVFGPNEVGLNEGSWFSPFGSYTVEQKDYIAELLNERLRSKKLLDAFGQPAKMLVTEDPYANAPNDIQKTYKWQFPAYRARRNWKEGGITEKQFIKAFSSKFENGGFQNQSLGKGKRMDTLTNDVESRKDIFKSKLKDNSNIALTKEIYKNAQNNPQILNMLMQDGPKENLAEDTGMQTAARGGVPDWYTGYNTALSPKQYRKLYRQMKRMMPRGLDISRANMASNFYDKRFMQPGYGTVVSTPEYMNMLAMSSLPLYKSAANVYGGGRKPSQLQANEATIINNKKGIPLLPEMTPDFIDSPLVGGSGGQFIAGDENLLTYDQGGFVDMDAENPLVRFIYGGNETGYYEPEDLPMAQFGGVPNAYEIHNYISNVQKNFPKNSNSTNLNTNTNNNTNTNTQNGKNCPQGYVWNATYNACIPVAQVTFNPRVVRGQSGLFRNLAPWNPAFSYAGSWTKQMSLPYQLGSGNPYMGQLTGAPVARYVTKYDRHGQPKKAIDIYDVGAVDDILSNYDYVGPENINSYDNNMQQTRQKSSGDRLDRRIARWDRRAARNEEEYEPMEGAITNYENPDDFYNAINPVSREDAEFLGAGYTASEDYKNKGRVRTVRDAEGNWYDRNDKMIPDKKAPSEVPGYYYNENTPLKNKNNFKEKWLSPDLQKYFKHGGLHTYAPGGANDPNTNPWTPPAWMSSSNPKQYGTYDGNMISQAPMGTTKGFDEFGNPVSQAPAFGIQPPAAASPENYYVKDQNPIKRNLVGVENKRKDMFNFDSQSLLNQSNAGFRTALNLFDPDKKTECPAGTTWNSDTQTCQPTDAMDIYAAATEQDTGDHVEIGSKRGLYRYNQMGDDRNSRATFGQYGGYMQNGGFSDPYFEEDEEVYMTPEELEQFLAAGGQVEYL